MSQAENLLNTVGDDISTFTADPETEGHIVIGKDRHITVPEELKRIAVQYDHNIETVTFDCPRYWDGHDMSTMQVYVNYLRSDSVAGSYICDSATVDESDSDIIHFDWTVSKDATLTSGKLAFLVCIKDIDEDGNEIHHWNSELCTDLMVSAGLESGEKIILKYPDIITHLLARMEHVEKCEVAVTGGQIQNLDMKILNLSNSLSMYRLTNDQNIQDLEDSDSQLNKRVDALEEALTGAEVAISHSLAAKGVSIPPNMSIKDVAGLIDVIEMDIPTALQSISVTTPPNQTEYYQGEPFNKSGMVVTANFGDGVTVPVESYTVSPTVMTEGLTEVTVSLTVNGVTKTTPCPVSVTSVIASTMPLGSMMYISEGDADNVLYRLVDKDYLGNMLLVREDCLDEPVAYLNVATTQAYLTKYDGSNLDTYLNSTFYGSLPTVTAEAIQAVDIPVRSDASAAATQVYLSRNVFILSATEWGVDGHSLEGTVVEYTSNRATGVDYWTRELTPGMANTTYLIKADGTRANAQCNSKYAVRPAFCISKNQPVKETSGGWMLAGNPNEAPTAYMTVDVRGNATIVGVSFSVDSEGNATITV